MKIWFCSGLVAVLTVGIALGQDSLTAVQQDIILGLKTYRFPEDQRQGFKLKNTLDDFRHPVIQQLLLDRFAQTQFDEAEAAAWEVEFNKSLAIAKIERRKEVEDNVWEVVKNDTLRFELVFDSLMNRLLDNYQMVDQKSLSWLQIVPKIYLSYIVDLDLREAIPLLIKALKDEKHYPYDFLILTTLARFQVEPYHTDMIKELSIDPVTGEPLCNQKGMDNVRTLCFIATQESIAAITNLIGCLALIRRDPETQIMMHAGVLAVELCTRIQNEEYLKLRAGVMQVYHKATQAQLEEVKAWMIANQGKYIIER